MYSHSQPYESHGGERQEPHRALRWAEGSLGWLMAALAVCGGVGWLYLLRHTGALAAGPQLHAALPLEELAGDGAQPLLRVAVAWLPAGFAAGLALTLATRMRAPSVAAGAGVLAFAILFATTAASEALMYNARLSRHILPALQRPGLWGAVAFVVIGSLLAVAAAGRRRAGARSAAPSASSAA